ncbi:MAG: prolipoprotein diacylglyceryl transferase, partial [Proteobacteria bacterium]|nr:prolipoprotein diacylglyceryl transferase [Pseudomonadota bacterium]
MYPDLLEIFGVTLHGIMFERVLWLLIILLMIWGIISSVLTIYKGRKAEGIIQGIIVFIILIWSGLSFLKTFQPYYNLVFEKPLVIHTYAFCILIGVTLGTLSTMKMAKDRGEDPKEMARLCILLIVFGFLGARAAHVIVEFSSYWNSCFHPELVGLNESSCLRVLNFAEGGLTFYGGVIAGMVVMTVFFMRRRKRNQPVGLLSVLDKLAAALAISHALGRLGCLAAGCCWGAITTGKLGVTYGTGSFAFTELVKRPELQEMMLKTGETPLLHATQIYEAVGELILCGLLWLMHKKKAKPGRMVGCWFACYGILRFIVEFMRDDVERGYYFEKSIKTINEFFQVPADHATILSTSQGIAIVMSLLGLGVLISTVFRKNTTVLAEGVIPENPSNQTENPATDSAQSPSNPVPAPTAAPAAGRSPSNPVPAPLAAPAAGRSPSNPVPAPTAAPTVGRSPSKPISAPTAAPTAGRSPSKPISAPTAAPTVGRSPSKPISAPTAAPAAGRSPSKPISAPMAAPAAGRSPSKPISAPTAAPLPERVVPQPISAPNAISESTLPVSSMNLTAVPAQSPKHSSANLNPADSTPPSPSQSHLPNAGISQFPKRSSANLNPADSTPPSPSQSHLPNAGISQSPKIVPAKTQPVYDLPAQMDISTDLPSVSEMEPASDNPSNKDSVVQEHQKDGLALATDDWLQDDDEFLDD